MLSEDVEKRKKKITHASQLGARRHRGRRVHREERRRGLRV